MTIRPYTPSDLPLMNQWLLERGHSEVVETPLTGLCVISSNIQRPEAPVAMAFIRLVEGGYGIYDGLVTDPSAPPRMRDFAIDLLTSALLQKAKYMGLTAIHATTADKNTLMRATSKHGFVKQPHAVIVVDLRHNAVKA